ncbi:hypothetical protein KW785_02575, partial [Candidatus Parcubacteria bacterium]|nr:hypothetical protein [Candidatus Parcubacteria bacterium]
RRILMGGSMESLGRFVTWEDVHNKAKGLLQKGQLDAVSFIKKSAVNKPFVSTVLVEFGEPSESLEIQIGIAKKLHGGRNGELFLGEVPNNHPFLDGKAWVLKVIYDEDVWGSH